MPLTKKAHEKISCPIAGFNNRYQQPGWPGKDGAGREWVRARHDFYRRGRIRSWHMHRVPDGGGAWVELVLEHGKFC
jgi:hypothetical protein